MSSQEITKSMREAADKYIQQWPHYSNQWHNFKACHLAGQLHNQKEWAPAIEFALMMLNHAIALDYLGEGSTRGMALDAIRKLEALHPPDERGSSK